MTSKDESDHWVVEGELRVHDLNEDALLARILPRLPIGPDTQLGPGDDAAMVQVPSGLVLASADILVEGQHFRRDWSSGADVGWRAAMQNLADIAAMGARASSLLVSLVCPPDLAVAWVEDLAEGLAQACAAANVGVVGGDFSGGDRIVVAVTVLGESESAKPVTRGGANPGDQLAHAGVRGHSAAGLAICTAVQAQLDNGGDADLGIANAAELVLAYLRPNPPLAAGLSAAIGGATAMLDLSDGLLRDAARIARASSVRLEIDDPQDVFSEDLGILAESAQVLGANGVDWVLRGGEDHGLLATFPAGVELPEPFRRIGSVLEALEQPDVLVNGRTVTGDLGWDHFAR